MFAKAKISRQPGGGNGLQQIDVNKIDVEGAELGVLQGEARIIGFSGVAGAEHDTPNLEHVIRVPEPSIRKSEQAFQLAQARGLHSIDALRAVAALAVSFGPLARTFFSPSKIL